MAEGGGGKARASWYVGHWEGRQQPIPAHPFESPRKWLYSSSTRIHGKTLELDAHQILRAKCSNTFPPKLPAGICNIDLHTPTPNLCARLPSQKREKREKQRGSRMEDSPADAAGSGRRTRTRTRGAEASGRAARLQQLRAVRNGEIRASDVIQVKVDAPIYDTVPEEEYNVLVARRKKEAGEFIIDDDGLGYVDDGREEDWSHRALPSSSDEGSDDEDGAPRKRKQPRPPQAKRQPQQSAKAAASFSAAAAKTGQQISSLFTSSVFKRTGSDRTKSLALAADSIVDDIIAEFAPDENDREERRRRVGRVSAPQPPPPTVSYVKPQKVIVDAEMVRSDNGNDMAVELKNDTEMETNLEEIPGSSAELVVDNLEEIPGSSAELVFDNKSLEEPKQEANGEVKVEKTHRLNAKIKAEESRNNDVTSATAGWMKICGNGQNAVGEEGVTVDGNTNVDESSEFELKDGALPFYILDAYEEPFGANSGTVYLFGKVNSTTLKFQVQFW